MKTGEEVPEAKSVPLAGQLPLIRAQEKNFFEDVPSSFSLILTSNVRDSRGIFPTFRTRTSFLGCEKSIGCPGGQLFSRVKSENGGLRIGIEQNHMGI